MQDFWLEWERHVKCRAVIPRLSGSSFVSLDPPKGRKKNEVVACMHTQAAQEFNFLGTTNRIWPV